MLQEALAVVEAARRLAPAPVGSVPGHWRFQCEPRKMAEAIRDLGETLQTFDASTGHARDPVALLVRAIRYAEGKGIPAEEMVNAIRAPAGPDDVRVEEMAPPSPRPDATPADDADDEVRTAESLTELRPQPGEIGRPDAVTDGSPVQPPHPELRPGRGREPEVADKYKPAPEMAPRMPNPAVAALAAVARPVPGGETAMGTRLATFETELGYDPALADGGEYTADAALEMDAIGDRLEFAVGKFGWTPKLKALAAAFIAARNKMAGDKADVSPTMQVSIADAMVVAKVSAELAAIEANPDFAYSPEELAEPEWTPPVPGRRY